MSEERELVKKRGSFKGRLTAFTNFLDSLKDKPLTSCDISELQLRIGKMESLYEQYDEVQLRLECIVEDIKLQFSERSEFESLYYKSLSRAQNMMSDYNGDNKSMENCKSTHSNVHKPVKLPTIQLPKFSGLYTNWLEFRDTFSSLVHCNDSIDEINKFHYLRASLEGSAAVVINAIEFSSSNYAVAWQLLCDRFDNKRLLIQNHVSALFHIESIVKESSVALKALIDLLNKDLRALESLGEPVKHWDTLLIYIVTRKLDQKTFREWEEHKGRLDKDSKITFEKFMTFLRNRADLIETLELSRNNYFQTSNKSCPKIKSMVATQSLNDHSNNTEMSRKVCPKCNNDHSLSNCPQFLALSNDARLKLLPTFKICFNCFRSGHYANKCKKLGCKLCKRRHNTLVHTDSKCTVVNTINNDSNNLSASSSLSSATTDTNNVALSANMASSRDHTQRDVLLSTAQVKLRDNNGGVHIVRAVLDSGSTSSFITDRLCRQLKLVTRQVNKCILGINNVTSHVGKLCRVAITSIDDSFTFDLNCFILPYITSNVPCREVIISDFNIPPNITLADPTFCKPAEVDMLIGADLFWDLLGSQRLKLGTGKPVLYETLLGWIVSGPISQNYISLGSDNLKCNFSETVSDCNTNNLEHLRSDLTKFWQLEEVNTKSSATYMPEEKLCEDHFVKNTTRLSDGRFCVRIPLKKDPSLLGDSFKKATHCLQSLERRLKVKPDFSRMYHDFMLEYETLGHMTNVNKTNLCSGYFIPHHGILRESSSTTKLRVVFNASCPTSTGVSFNDLQMVGPTVQDDLLSILFRFRCHKYVLAADVEKMYRQISVHPSDRHFQQVVWRDNVGDRIKVYELNTVTYGTASAPFLATRCLKQIGLECCNPKISEIITHDFYVDDLLTGCDDLDEAKFIRSQVTNELASACMPLRKWKSNEPQLVSDTISDSFDLNIGSNEPDKLLGLGWYVNSDELGFPLKLSEPSAGYTKRDLLSAIARIFDPLGLLCPVVVSMKILLQKMWLDKLSWDQPLPIDISQQWNNIVKSLPLLNHLRIPRIVLCNSYKEVELHVFTDASESAYGACVYIRSINDKGEHSVRLLMAKSRVAPIKPTTIPRLELCGAVVGSRLYEKVATSLRVTISRVYCWTDSTIVLGWLQMLPTKLQPFVRNRVAEVLDKAGNCTWRHVPTDQNPADLISRGVDISVLRDLHLWWSGPEFLRLDPPEWPSQVKYSGPETLPETRPNVVLNAVISEISDAFIEFNRFSNYSRLIRSVAYVLRFIKSCQKQYPKTNYLTQDELQDALTVVIRRCQFESFPEHKLLLNKKNLPQKSALLKFNVYLDDKNVMRVGGRLDNSNFVYNKKHPCLLQSTHQFTKLLFHFEHKRLMHAGPQLLLASIRESYWPIGGRNLAKACYRKCVLCRRMKGKVVAPIMGNLPQERLRPGYPFESTGVDYAGPIMCASRQGRGCRLVKVYIAIFICFATKAIHLELVGDLTGKSYLLALHRFIARRGKPVDIFSDNGTSFVGAYNELSKFLKLTSSSLSEDAAKDGIKFHFIPAYTPHFGGLWEAGVKSTKYHLQRVLGNCNFTFEELYTALTKIEAVLNSRPLTPLSSDPADYTPLTPGHFLVGRPLVSLPEPDYHDYSANHLSRFQRIEQLRQHFWSRWSKEYVAELQLRTKWHSSKDSLTTNTMVVIKEDYLPPLKWSLGRIVAVYPGKDGIARVADIRTSTGVIRRAFNRICPLPVSSG